MARESGRRKRRICRCSTFERKNGGGTGEGSVGAITNYLESGHKIRPPGGGKDYRPRINVPYVKGYFFYEAAGVEAERIALEEAERFADELADMLERSP